MGWHSALQQLFPHYMGGEEGICVAFGSLGILVWPEGDILLRVCPQTSTVCLPEDSFSMRHSKSYAIYDPDSSQPQKLLTIRNMILTALCGDMWTQ